MRRITFVKAVTGGTSVWGMRAKRTARRISAA